MIGNWIEAMVRRIPRLPRKWRVVRNLVCIVLLLLFIWCALGIPVLTAERAFRRAEQANLKEPSEIIYRMEEDNNVCFVGKGTDEYLIGRFSSSGFYGWNGSVQYWEKTGKATLVPFQSHGAGYSSQEMLLFYEIDGVARGEVDLTVSDEGTFNNVPYSFSEAYTIQFEPAGDGVLTGWLNAKTPDDDSWESYVERRALRKIFDEYEKLPIEIRLYDSEGKLVLQETKEYSYPGWW